jgi:formamidopyrimidine-DNA glycosylase
LPELPEVECIVRDLKRNVTGRTITGLKFLFYQMLQGAKAEEFSRQTRGKVIEDVERKGKYILFSLSSNQIMEIHLRMTGRLFFCSAPVNPDKYTGAIFYLDRNAELHFQDIRKFGTFKLYGTRDLSNSKPFLLGPDPLCEAFVLEFFLEILHNSPKKTIKAFLLDQRKIAGLGNIYTDEALFRAGVHPGRRVNSLNLQEKKRIFYTVCSILQEGIFFKGTSFSDYRDLWGGRGEFQERLRVYRRGKEPCPNCGTAIERKILAGRGTYFCPCCQPFFS